jgi:ubiquinol-cytochrome c reductase cytochrome c1 subunit
MGGGGVPKRAHPLKREWYWEKDDPVGVWRGLDWNSIRRGRQVYTEVFAPCHPISRLTFNHFQAFMTKEEIKALAAQYEILDKNPNEDGTDNVRPGKGTDWLPEPYPNQQAAAAGNNGAAPPDMRWIIKAKEDGADYIFALLTGYKWGEYMEIPPWMSIKPGQFWNPYFKGGILAMPPPLSDGLVDFADGTPATTSQMAKDVVNFLRWTYEPEFEDRRVWFWKCSTTLSLWCLCVAHVANKNATYQVMKRSTYRFYRKPW